MSKPLDLTASWKHMVAGAGAGWATSLVTCPLDVVKTRMQSLQYWHGHVSGQSAPPNNTPKALLYIWRTEGIRGLYRGLTPTMIGYLPSFAIYFSVYQRSKRHVERRFRKYLTGEVPLPAVNIVSAIIAGTCSNLSTNPLWVVRTRMMTQHLVNQGKPVYQNTLDAFRSIFKNEGLRAFYKGAGTSLLGVTHVAIQLPLYEWLKSIQPGAREQTPRVHEVLLASITSKIVASTVTYPHEVRTIIVISY